MDQHWNSSYNLHLVFWFLWGYICWFGWSFLFWPLNYNLFRLLPYIKFLLFYRVSKGVRDLPGSFQSATNNVPSGTSVLYFALLLASGVFFIIIAVSIFLPVMVLTPQKFAICFTIGCGLIIASLFALKGPKNQLRHMLSKEVFWNVFLFLLPFYLSKEVFRLLFMGV